MTTTRTVLLFNLILLQLFLFNTSSASVLSSLTSRNDRDQHDEDFDFDVHNLFLMEVDELNEIQRYLNSTAPKHPPKNHKAHSSGGGGSSHSSSGSGGGSGGTGNGSGSSGTGGGGGDEGTTSYSTKSSKKSKNKKQSSGLLMGAAAIAVAGVAAVYQNQNREIVVEGEQHVLKGSIARRMKRFDKMAGKASPEARGTMVEMSPSSFSGESYGDDEDTAYVNMENIGGNSSDVSMSSSTGGANAMAMV